MKPKVSLREGGARKFSTADLHLWLRASLASTNWSAWKASVTGRHCIIASKAGFGKVCTSAPFIVRSLHGVSTRIFAAHVPGLVLSTKTVPLQPPSVFKPRGSFFEHVYTTRGR